MPIGTVGMPTIPQRPGEQEFTTPAGDIKKISTFSGNTVSSSWGSTPNTHWRLIWTANANGHGVTEGGSSGSPIFNNSSGRIVGTLTGGGAYYNATNQPDFYGKVSYHWISNGNTNNRRLKPFLDPANTGALTQNGSGNPCSAAGVNELDANLVSIYPNPTENKLSIALGELAKETQQIDVLDITGKLVRQLGQPNSSIAELELNGLAQGIYHVVISTQQGTITKQVIKQ